MAKKIHRQNGVIQLIPLLIILAVIITVSTAIIPSFKDKMLLYFKGFSQAVVTKSPTPLTLPSPTPVVTPEPTPTKTPIPKPSGTPKPSLVPAPVTSTTLPVNGYANISVSTDIGTFRVVVAAADVATTRIVVDTASDSDCTSNCPVLPLASYVSRRGAFAGINGTFFCPAEPAYASCGANNSFNFLVMNINKTYLNSSMNVYSTNPGAIFASGYVRFVGAIQEWGRDTGPDGVISNYPLLVSGGNISFNGSGDSKMTVKTTRSFVANKGNIVYIGDVFGASAADVAHVLKTLGVDNALNLDDAGSAAFWYGGYKVGPGRNIPNAILFITR